MRRPILTAAAPACLLLGLTPAAAAADIAPPGHATATAASVSGLAQISRSTATADQTKSEAKADVISVGGTTVPGTGGSQADEGQSGGSLIDTGPGSAPQLRVAPWKAKSSGAKGEKRSSSAEAALARIDVPARTTPQAGQKTAAADEIRIGVLTSKSDAEHSSTQSTGTSTSDAADIQIGNSLRLVLLHSEVTSNAKGNSYLVGFNGTKIGTQEQLNELCSLDVSGVAALSCLTAGGGTANGITTGSAEVLGVETTLGLDPASAFATTGTMATGATGSAPNILESVATALPLEAPRAAAAAAPAPEAALPRTGVAAGSLAASGVTGLLMGLILRMLGRRRSAGTA